jgi:hypothetical protein
MTTRFAADEPTLPSLTTGKSSMPRGNAPERGGAAASSPRVAAPLSPITTTTTRPRAGRAGVVLV